MQNKLEYRQRANPTRKKCKPSNNTNNTTTHNITIQPRSEIKPPGNLSIMDLQQAVPSTYQEATIWERNLLAPPAANASKEYTDEYTRLILEWVNDSQLQRIAIKALMHSFPMHTPCTPTP